MNAIMNKNSASVKNCVIYVALFPCNECAKLIIQSGQYWMISPRSLLLIHKTVKKALRAFFCANSVLNFIDCFELFRAFGFKLLAKVEIVSVQCHTSIDVGIEEY